LSGSLLRIFREALKYSGFRPVAALEVTVSVGVAKRDANKSALL